jgi:outer membrane protein TolC
LAKLRYDSFYPSYLEVLDASRQWFAAELALSQAQRDSLVSVVQLLQGLGRRVVGGRCAQAIASCRLGGHRIE